MWHFPSAGRIDVHGLTAAFAHNARAAGAVLDTGREVTTLTSDSTVPTVTVDRTVQLPETAASSAKPALLATLLVAGGSCFSEFHAVESDGASSICEVSEKMPVSSSSSSIASSNDDANG